MNRVLQTDGSAMKAHWTGLWLHFFVRSLPDRLRRFVLAMTAEFLEPIVSPVARSGADSAEWRSVEDKRSEPQ